MNERDIFTVAREITDPVKRSAYLGEACGNDTALRTRLEALLRAHDNPDSVVDAPAVAPFTPTEHFSAATPSSPDSPTLTHGEGRDDDADDGLGFLSPSSRRDSLGRLGHYEVLEVLGKGGFGIVFRAFDDVLQRVVAVKVLAPSMAATSPARKRFIREARSSAAVRHENVVQVYAVEEQPLPHIVMEFVPGETLQQRLDRTGPLEAAEVLPIARQIAAGLAAAHEQSLIHRDIKPSNILIDSGPQQQVRITDFGLARAADDASLTRSGVVAGTPMYMAPEQAKGETLDQRADLFSLGSVMYTMLSGRPPFRAENTPAVLKRVADDTPRPIREVIPEVPVWLCRIVEKLHAKDPAERYQSAQEVADVLADCEAQLKANARIKDFSRIPRAEPTPRRFARWKWAAAAIILLPLLVLTAAEFAGLTHFFRSTALNYEVTILVDDPNIRIRYCAAKENETPEAFAERFRDMVRRQDLSEALIAITPFGGNKISLPAGSKWWFICERNEELLYHQLVHVDRAKEVHLPWAAELAKRTNFVAKAEPGWVQLFNGKDTSSWIPSAKTAGTWQVKDGVLIGSNGPGFLFTQGSYTNFHLRLQARINATGNSGVSFRKDWHLEILGHESDLRTGTLRKIGSKQPLCRTPSSIAPDTWFTMEILAVGPSLAIRVNDDPWQTTREPEANPAARLELEVLGADTTVQFRKIEIKELPADEPGWVQLFNGKDLSDWTPVPKKPDQLSLWAVEDGELVGRNLSECWLLHKSGSYDNFHLRAELKFTGGVCGFHFRIDESLESLELGNGVTLCDSAQIPFGTPRTGRTLFRSAAEKKVSPDRWFVAEVIAEGPRVKVLVDGVLVADHPDTAVPSEATANGKRVPDKVFRPLRGRIALQQNLLRAPLLSTDNAMVRFRKIEIKRLPAEVKDPPSAEPGWVQLFNGKDLAGWKYHPSQQGFWSIEDGLLRGSGKNPCHLFSERGDYADFHLRIRAKARSACQSAVIFRAPFSLPDKTLKGIAIPTGYKASISLHPLTPATGSLPGFTLAKDGLIKDNEWFDLDIIAQGKRLIVKVNGETTADFVDAQSKFSKGHIALQQLTSDTQIFFSKIEIRELPLSANPPSPALAVAPFDETKAKEYQQEWAKHLGVKVEFTNKIGMELCVIPPGEFLMGSKQEDVQPRIETLRGKETAAAKIAANALQSELPQHPVRISRPFAMGKTEVTVAQYRKFVQASKHNTSNEPGGGWGFRNGMLEQGPQYDWENVGYKQDDTAPVWNVGWTDAVAFCKWLSHEEGKRYRLPTEAEWEFACRAGTTTRAYWTGEGKAWGLGKRDDRPMPVAQLKANPFGLCDMIGNVWEWCHDWHSTTYYQTKPYLDPKGPEGPSKGAKKAHHVMRGGGISGGSGQLTSTARSIVFQETVGFRVVCELDRPTPPQPDKKAEPASHQPLRDAIATKEQSLAMMKVRYEAGTVSMIEVLAAQSDLCEAQIKLAEAERDTRTLINHLQDLVKYRQEERELIKLKVEVGVERADALNQADARLADAKARLNKAAPPELLPEPKLKP